MILLLRRLADVWADTAELARLRDLCADYAAQVNEAARSSNAWQQQATEAALERTKAVAALAVALSDNIRLAHQLEQLEAEHAKACRAGCSWMARAKTAERTLAERSPDG